MVGKITWPGASFGPVWQAKSASKNVKDYLPVFGNAENLTGFSVSQQIAQQNTTPSLTQIETGMLTRFRDNLSKELVTQEKTPFGKLLFDLAQERNETLDKMVEKSPATKDMEKQLERAKERRKLQEKKTEAYQAQKEFLLKRQPSSQANIAGRRAEIQVNGEAGRARVEREAREAEMIVRQEQWRRGYTPPVSSLEQEKQKIQR